MTIETHLKIYTKHLIIYLCLQHDLFQVIFCKVTNVWTIASKNKQIRKQQLKRKHV